ncbi:MAG: acyltransferase [Planctomycetes bacterium]|jgi:peptidoglycan/LPS O-acetylase OafA/YrhL|nr:acyltransferase [Planctomycetota bacterium]
MTTRIPPSPLGAAPARSVALDALRFVAVALVLGRHLLPPLVDPKAGLPLGTATWRAFGWVGVDLFFVLSGFLVAGLLFAEHRRTGDVNVWHFLARRGFKIYPAFYVMLGITWLWFGAHLPLSALMHEALFVQNYLQPVIWNHTWSLAVEEHFYLLLALALGAAVRMRPGSEAMRGVPTVVAFVCITVLGLRLVAWYHSPGSHLLFPTHLRIDALAFGAWLAYAFHYHRERMVAFVQGHRALLMVAAAGLLLPSLLLPVETSFVVNVFGLTANYLAGGAVLALCVVRGERPDPNWVRWLARVGVHSYSIYLWHMPVLRAVRWWVEPRCGHGVAVLVYLVGAVLVGVVMAAVVERPFLALRERWLPSRSRAVAPAVAAREPALAGR